MEKKPPLIMTSFDQEVTTEFIQIMKLMIPYLPPQFQRMAGIFAKLTELQNAIYYFQPPYHHSRRGRLRQRKMNPGEFMDELRPYLTPDSCEMMDNVVQAMSMMEMMQAMDTGGMDSDMGDMMQTFMNMSGMNQDTDMSDMMQAFMNMGCMGQSMDMDDMTQNCNDVDGGINADKDQSPISEKERMNANERMDGSPGDEEHRSGKTGTD